MQLVMNLLVPTVLYRIGQVCMYTDKDSNNNTFFKALAILVPITSTLCAGSPPNFCKTCNQHNSYIIKIINSWFRRIKNITEKILRKEWNRESSLVTLHSKVLLWLGVWDKWIKILHSSNFLEPNYNSKKHFLKQWAFKNTIFWQLP